MIARDPIRTELPSALVLGGGYSALGIVQSLGSRGLDVYVVHHRREIAGRSRWARYRSCPNPISRNQAWVVRVYEICRRLSVRPVIFASADPEAHALSRAAARLRDVAGVRTSSVRTVDTVLDKAAFGEWTASRDLSSPETIRANRFAREGADLGWPLVAKPRFRSDREIRRRGWIERFTLLESPAEWAAYRHTCANRLDEIVLQRFVAGTTADMYCVGVCADRGALEAVFTGRKVRGYPALFGDAIVGESTSLPEHVLDEVRRVARDLELDGLSEFEYKRDPRTGEFSLIEINPRAWSWIAGTIREGSNLPAVAWELAAGQPVPGRSPVPSRASVRYVRVVPDFVNVCWRYRKDHPEWARSPRAWWHELGSPDLVIAESHMGDRRILVWGLVRAFTQEIHTWPRRPWVGSLAQAGLDLAQTFAQALLGALASVKTGQALANSLARVRARLDRGFEGRVRHIQQVLGERELAKAAPSIELERSASTFLDGVAVFRELCPGRGSPDISAHGLENVTRALRGGRGAILWLANISYSRLLLRKALFDLGLDYWQLSRLSHGFSDTGLGRAFLNPMWRCAEDRYLGRRLLISDAEGQSTVSHLRAMRRHLSKNGVVSITVGDEADEVAYVPLFAGSLAISTGPARLALASGAPLLPVFGSPRGSCFEVWIEPPLEPGSDEDAVRGLVRDYGRRLSPRVERDPQVFRVWHQALPAETSAPRDTGVRAGYAPGPLRTPAHL